MTEGRDYYRMRLYGYRAGLHKNRPAIIGYHNFKNKEPRQEVLKNLEDLGMTTLYSDGDILADVDAAIPDTFGKTQEEIDKMPRNVRSYKCGKFTEKGDPFCGDVNVKWNQTICPDRRFRSSWHPGW
jgi:hypothetical protein